MLAIILKLTHSTAFKDTAAVARGIYRVSEGYFFRSPSNAVRNSSWMDPIPAVQPPKPNEPEIKFS